MLKLIGRPLLGRQPGFPLEACHAKVLVFAGDWNLVEDFEDHLSEKIG